MKKALITGVSGQDGSYLARHLISMGYEVHGIDRRTSKDTLVDVQDLIEEKKIKIHDASLADLGSIRLVMEEVVPDEVYNLAAQSQVGKSFKMPIETWEVNYYGAARVFNEALLVNPKVKIYQASTSEMFGDSVPPQSEATPFEPVSPYARAKLKTHEDFVVGYREKKGAFICSGILFNHESPTRGVDFVTRKVTKALARIKLGTQDLLEIGNMNAIRDWGYAGDYVKAMYLMMQQEKPEDFVVATGETHTVRDFINSAAKALDMDMAWEGEKENEIGKDKDGKIIVRVNPEFYRPNEVNHLLGDATKARNVLGWKPDTSFDELVSMMVKNDLEIESKSIGS